MYYGLQDRHFDAEDGWNIATYGHIKVNGESKARSRLMHKDRITIGDYDLLFSLIDYSEKVKSKIEKTNKKLEDTITLRHEDKKGPTIKPHVQTSRIKNKKDAIKAFGEYSRRKERLMGLLNRVSSKKNTRKENISKIIQSLSEENEKAKGYIDDLGLIEEEKIRRYSSAPYGRMGKGSSTITRRLANAKQE